MKHLELYIQIDLSFLFTSMLSVAEALTIHTTFRKVLIRHLSQYQY